MERTFTLLKTVLIAIVIILSGKTAHSQTTYYDNYAFRIPLTINNTSLGISTDQTNFVALLKVVSPTFVTGPCQDQTGGSASIPPFAIIDSAYSTSTELNYQIESWDSSTGTIYFWVKVPTLYKSGSANGLNKFYVYFGPTGTTSVSHTTAWQKQTWSNVTAAASITYGGVYHFNEDPSGAAPQFADGTVHSNDVSTVSTGTVTQNTSSQIGAGITLSATSVMATGVTGMPNSQDDQSLSLWASYPSTPPHTANFMVLENSTNPTTTGNGTQLGILVETAVTPLPRVQTWRWANRKTPLVQYGTAPSTNTWHHYAYTYKASTKQSWLYIDGTLVTGPTSNSGNPPFSGAVDMVSFGDYINNNIGGSGLHTPGGQSYTGTMDEAHIIGATLSADWVKAEYINQRDAATFTTAGSMQTNSTRASTVAGYLTYTWKGINTNASDPNNWNNTTSGVSNEAPVNSNVSWVIPAGLSNYPTLGSSTGCYALTIGAGAYVNLNGKTLSVGCNIYNSSGGQILYNNNYSSKITWNGALSSQYYYGSNTAGTAQLGAMEVNNSVAGTIDISGGPVDIYSLLTLTKGKLVIESSPAALTLKSTQAQTANFAAIPSGCSISGTVNVERFVKGSYPTDISKRAYRLISSAVYTGTVSGVNVYDINYLQNSVLVSGAAGGGFNATPSTNPSTYLFREDLLHSDANYTTGLWKGIAKINNANAYDIGTQKRLTTANIADTTVNIPVGNGVLFFFRGNKNNNGSTAGTKTTLPYNYPEDVTLTQTGTLNTGTINVKLWFANSANGLGNNLSYTTTLANSTTRGFTFVGNPYASTINWEKYNRNSTVSNSSIYGSGGLGSTIYMWNATTKQFEAYMQKAGAVSAADTTTNLDPGTAVGSATNMIASGEGFFVRASSTTQSLSFRETAKTTAQPSITKMNDLMGKPKITTAAPEPLVRLQLIKDTKNNDEIVVRLNDKASAAYTSLEDAEDMGGMSPEESMSVLSSDSVKLCISTVPFPRKTAQVMPLFVSATASGTYQLKLSELRDLPAIYSIWLKDNLNRDSVNLREALTYSFDINLSDPGSFGTDRFQLIIGQNPNLTAQLLNLDAVKTKDGSLVKWKAKNEFDYTIYYVERSTDKGTSFEQIGRIVSNGSGNYTLLDKKPVIGDNRYRINQFDFNNDATYSNVVKLSYSLQSDNISKISIYPNPAATTINLTMGPATTQAAYTIRIMNSAGTVVKQSSSQQSNWKAGIADLKPGTYLVQVMNSKSKSLVGITSFVKD
ncbi:DUF2341 domain-containing protein [Mucilaginibacter sp.]|jgi:hypothetical protein|uniref:DUF2341 domain-containing protein n=1 Tax=Mucilaginibacter sp. TaxID=1882438 RepID=UPI002BED2F53|nr:DUF2341 domain-containing protein [Mucilaginibacter sp.]HTI57559.1 DUF2341 domain-containing protein [Mucilaginibacter sp.]